MPDLRSAAVLLAAFAVAAPLSAEEAAAGDMGLLRMHCSECHKDVEPAAGFSLRVLANSPARDNLDLWVKSLGHVSSGYMPPPPESQLSAADRQRLTLFLEQKIRSYRQQAGDSMRIKPRRLNNRELSNSVRDLLMIEHVGTDQPTANLLGDTLEDGFDTDGNALGMSQFHLEQYIDAFRAILDSTILPPEQPDTRLYHVRASDMSVTSLSQSGRPGRADRTAESIDFLDPRLRIYFSNFDAAPATGRYRIRIAATGKDRGVYDSTATGIHDDDPIQLSVHLGDRVKVFSLPDEEVMEIELNEWITAGTRIELSYPTDGLRLEGNKNFKFQYRITHDYLLKNDPERYAAVVREVVPKAPARTAKSPKHWSHWVGEWQGPRPRVFNATIEGPFYESWPPKRQIALLGEDPKLENAAAILRPIAERAWRRNVGDGELDSILRLVRSRAETVSEIEALKEGIVAILVSPSFLILNPGDGALADRFATKLSYFLKSTIPDEQTRAAARNGALATFQSVRAEVQRQFDQSEGDEFLREFPHAWLELDRINFMAPDPDRFPLYDRKRLSEDMINEALRFFSHMVDNNLPVPEFLSADYSFLNADLARVYGVDDVPQDSKLRKYTFANGRRGGLLGMGAFLTLTADTLSTSPIHRAVYVMEKFMGLHPAPPPPDVNITEPDVRQAKTIKEILAAHTADPSCASCHSSIDPWGYAFESFDPVGAWRDEYTMHIAPKPSREQLAEIENQDRKRAEAGLPPMARPWENQPIPVDAASWFPDGARYKDITEYRKHLLTDKNRDRFVRCFIAKLLTYANGTEPVDSSELDKILARSAEQEYRIIDTIAAVVDSPLFREQ